MNIIGKYKNGNYQVTIWSDGTKERFTKEDEFIPSFAENCDCKITDKCSIGCAFCYENCTANGKHGDLFSYKFIDTLHPYTELALNGNDMDHPDLEKFLRKLKEKKVFPNITVQQKQFLANYDKLKAYQEEGLVYGIGISTDKTSVELIEKAKTLKNTVFHTINGITTPEQYELLAKNKAKILILGYKDLGRGVSFKENKGDEVESNQKWLYENLERLSTLAQVVSFDNLAIEQLEVKRLLTQEQWEEFYMGDDGHFTFYIDMVKGEFAKDSLSQVRWPIGNKSIDEMFQIVLQGNETEEVKAEMSKMLDDILKKMESENKSYDDPYIKIRGLRPDNKKDFYTYREYIDVLSEKVTSGHIYDMVKSMIVGLLIYKKRDL